MPSLAAIFDIANRVREAILALPLVHRPPVFEEFPRESCGWASLLLGAVLKDEGIEGFVYVCGERPGTDSNRTASHAWLARGTLVVDITADQFPDAPNAIIVANPSVWHMSFQEEHREPADFRETLGPGTYPLLSAYSKVNKLFQSSAPTQRKP